MVSLNIYAGVITVAALFGSLFVMAILGDGDVAAGTYSFPYAVAALLLLFDLGVRAFLASRDEPPQSSQILRVPGTALPPRKPSEKWLEALFSREYGGQYYSVIPVWCLAIATAVLTVLWRSGLLDWLFEAK